MRKMEESLRNSNTELRKLKRELEKDLADSVSKMMKNDSVVMNRAMQNNSNKWHKVTIEELQEKTNSLDIIIKNLLDGMNYGEIKTADINQKLQIASKKINELYQLIKQL